MKSRAETTDPIPTEHAEIEEGEEESLTEDETITTRGSPGSYEALLENLRLDQRIAVPGGWHTDASNI